MTIIYFVLIFGLVVVAHEFGHFLLAKANGIHVIEFAVGMGPKLISKQKGETLYSLRLLPLGGYCAMEGEDGESKDPNKVYEMVLSEIEKLQKQGLYEDSYNRAKKVIWGRYIRTHNDIEDLATTFLQYLFMGVDYFNYYDVYQSVTFDDIKNRFKEHFRPEYSALSVINPN